jgi:hypothetical protein
VNNTARDEGAIVLGWLTKLMVVMAVLGVLAYDGISILTANISTSDRANTLASEAADDVKSMKDINKAYTAIVTEAEAHGDTIAPEEFRVAPDGHVTLVLRTEAASLWMTHVGPLRQLLKVHATGEGTPSS